MENKCGMFLSRKQQHQRAARPIIPAETNTHTGPETLTVNYTKLLTKLYKLQKIQDVCDSPTHLIYSQSCFSTKII